MLEIRNIVKTFNEGTPGEVRALQSLSITVSEGEWVVLLGTNGSGKSSLMEAIAGTFIPDEGTIHLGGQDITEMPVYVRAGLIGRVFQNPFAGTAPDMSIAENLALAAMKGGTHGLGWALGRKRLAQIKERVEALHMGLEKRLNEKIGCLSGGERQALTLLMATWIRPQLLLLDEHTAALDPKTAAEVISQSREIIRRDRLTTLMVTHSMQQAVSMGDRIVMMHRGSIVHDFPAEEKKNLKVRDLMELFNQKRGELPNGLNNGKGW
ncbi:MAG: ABC transporter ATP-binding protein [Vulcanimicrobiota bacterium]